MNFANNFTYNHIAKNFKEGDLIYIKYKAHGIGDTVISSICLYADVNIVAHNPAILTYADVYTDNSATFFARYEGMKTCYLHDIIDIRKANADEYKMFLNAMVDAWKEYNLDWDQYVTDSKYYDISDWLVFVFNMEVDPSSEYLNIVIDCRDHIWSTLYNENVPESAKEKTPKELVMCWFDHIAQLADDHKNQNGVVMSDYQTFLEIKSLAITSREFVNRWYDVKEL